MNYKRITVETLSKIAIALCVILAISIFVGTIKNNTFETASHLETRIFELEKQIVNADEIIAQSEAKIAEAEKKLPDLKAAEKAAEKKLDKANDELDAVCDNYRFRVYSCDNPELCEPLHSAVSSASSAYSSASDKLEKCEDKLYSAKNDIKDANNQKKEFNTEIKRLSALKTKVSWSRFFLIIAMLLAIVGLFFISKFMLDKTNRMNGLIACAMLATASFLYMVLPTATTFLTYLFGIGIFVIFAALISDKIQNRIAARVFAIIFSVIIFFVTLLTAPLTALCFAVTFILISLILVPCVFTEYLDIAKHIFFTIITFGIWHLIWMYNFTENLNKVEQAEKRAPIRELLLCMFLPLYYIFWTYKTAGNTELYAEEKGKHFKIDILCFALSVLNPLLASVIIQDKTNVIVGKPVIENDIEETPTEEVSTEDVSTEGVPEETVIVE